MKVLFLVNYPAERAWKRWKNKQERESPTHHLWGITHLDKYGIEVDLLPYEKFAFLRKIGEKLKIGDVDQQLRVLQNLSKYDLVYSASQTSTIVLALLRLMKLIGKPVVVKLERPFKSTPLSKRLVQVFARSHGKLLCLSSRVENQLVDEFGISKDKVALLNWGPDLPSYDEIETNPAEKNDAGFIMSAGTSSRDHDTLVKAFREIDYPLRIYCAKASAPTVSPIPEKVKFYYSDETATTALSWKELVAEYRRAYAIAIPIYIPERRVDTTPLYGLTSLLDAMAVGKATIMTKHRQVNIDIEKEGIGLWVEPGDVKGWQRAVSYLLEHPEETREMGKRARLLAEKKYNLEIFSAQLAEALKSVFTPNT